MSPVIPVWPALLLSLVLVPLSTLAVTMDCAPDDSLVNENRYYYCYNADSNSTASWALVSATGQITHIGSCFPDRNCTQPASSNFRLYRSTSYSRLYFSSILRGLSGSTVVCTETFLNGSTDAVNCTLRVVSVRLRYCGSRGYEEIEGWTFRNWYCDLVTSSPVTWSRISASGHTTRLATCSSPSTDCATFVTNTTAFRGSSYTRVSIRKMSRDMGGTLQCSDGTDTDSCTLDVQNPAQVQNCDLHIQRSNWTAEISCDVTGAYSMFENFGFLVYQGLRGLLGGRKLSLGWYLFDDRESAVLAPYINSTDRRVYYRGTYAYTFPLPHAHGDYTYTLHAYPGGTSTTLEPLTVEHPASPSVRCESGTVCVCSTPSVGQPQGRLVWLSGDTVLAAGQYGQTLLQLSPDIGADGAGLTLTCQLDWAIKYNASLTLLTPITAPNTTAAIRATERTGDTGSLLAVAVSGYVLLAAVLAVGVVVVVLLLKRRARNTDTDSEQRPPYQEGHDYTSLSFGLGSTGGSSGSPKTPEAVYENTVAISTDGP